ncbi:hypothetical protein LTR10_017508 [Elasticomyces elasticus]|uniref:Uncharacterized protein n=1 Tax=Exophiala sideris TaxID=1016849 RepID=A0ABR0IZY4_9EURO|nr:hypothetical protein LTR10_017508 [Elasticomyces elasticus]KAK5023487.1 hypothetical protein LTS07_009362 [Exophiala sideris]KAK5028138.1 hypothetical protein LTR13_009126 [Exophiala sideris]KAK5052796.1 hypothetical protein LTR69_009622 [Exophiala sideris]KAK5178407.1 hypothetical protein LTR44_009032 [Eurotiomycetes sp. CCFEE 6388]
MGKLSYTSLTTGKTTRPTNTTNGFQFLNQIPTDTSDVKSNQPDLLQKYWLRTLSCIFVPLLVTGYYAGLYAYWILRYDDSGPVAQGPPAGRWAYYIWFVISATGIGLSKYGLAGVEAGMLYGSTLRAGKRDAVDGTLRKGWFKMRTRPSPTWTILAIVSLTPYIALPLSGFTLQLTNGYSTSNSKAVATLVGQRPDTFLDQNLGDVFTRSFNRWGTSAISVLPARSAYYVPADNASAVDRSWLQTFPNTWPDNQNVSLFIAPQSNAIVNGEAWGLEAKLNCSIVSHISQFELLSQRNEDGTAPRCPAITFNSSDEMPEYEGLPNLCDFDVYTLAPIDNATLFNLNILDMTNFPVGMMEIAVGYNQSEWEYISFSNLDPVLIEAALWQNPIQMVQKCDALDSVLSNNIGTVVQGMQKEFALNDITTALTGQTDTSPKTLDAIGFSCRSTYRTGTATINGRDGTYESFTHVEADPIVSATPVPIATAIPRIFRSEVSAALSLQDMYGEQGLMDTINALDMDLSSLSGNMDLNPMAYIASNVSWLQNIYKSVDAFYRQPIYCDEDGNVNVTVTSAWQQLQLINSTQFMTSMMHVFQSYALEMTRPTVQTQRANWQGNLTVVEPTLIISAGDVPAWPVLALLIVWAVSCVALGVVFGARRRWSETLDGFSMFRFGADYPEFRAATVNGRMSTRDYVDCHELTQIPGLIGDARPDAAVGYITLVERWNGQAMRRKGYL